MDSEGIVFHSKSELKRWKELCLMEKLGQIRDLRRQVSFALVIPNGKPILTRTGLVSKYTADFVYKENGKEIIEDFKGYHDKFSKFRIAVFEAISGKQVRISK